MREDSRTCRASPRFQSSRAVCISRASAQKPVRAHVLQLMRVRNTFVRFRKQAHATPEKVRRKHLDHIAEKPGHRPAGKLSLRDGVAVVHKPVSIQEALQKPESQAAVDK